MDRTADVAGPAGGRTCGLVLLTGATGYVGGRLLPLLAARGIPVRCLARRPENLRDRVPPGVEVVAGDVLDAASLGPALAGVGTAYYLVHSMGGSGDFAASMRDFAQALTVMATVISRRPGVAIVDAGYKAFATDRPFTPAPVNLPGVTYHWAGDEHGRLDLSQADCDLRVGDRVAFVPPHCDPTVNLYDVIHALRGDAIEGVWAVAARGKSQ